MYVIGFWEYMHNLLVSVFMNTSLTESMPTGIITEEEKEEEGKGNEEEKGGSSVGGIVAGVTIPLVLTVVAVVGVIAGVWLWRRYIVHVFMWHDK